MPITLWKGEWRGEARLYIRAPYGDRASCQGLGSSLWNGEERAWHVPFTPSVVAAIEAVFWERDLEKSVEVKELWVRAKAISDAQSAKGAVVLDPLPTKTDGWLHQRRAFHFAKDLDASGLFLDMGGGKTLVAIALMDHWDAQLVLVLCPKSVLGVWAKEFAKHSKRNWLVWSMSEHKGSVVEKNGRLTQWLAMTGGLKRPRAAIINYDSAWRGRLAYTLQSSRWDVEVLDESHRIKAPGGVTSKFAKSMRKSTKRVLLLTGTPQPHGPGDVYAQYRAADTGVFGTSFSRFRSKYFETKKINDKVEVIVDFKDDFARTEFTRQMGSIGIVIPRADMLVGPSSSIDPSRVWTLEPVERQVFLSPKTFKVYQELKKELVTEIDEGIVTADNALVKLMRLRQIVSGHVKTTDGLVATIGSEKRSALADIFEDIPVDEPVIVIGVFHHDLDAIRHVTEEAGRPYVELSGRRRDGLSAESTFAGEHNEVLGCQLQSGGVGIDLTRSCYVVNYSLDFNLGNVTQIAARYDRPGQWRPVTVVNLVAVNPVGGMTVDGATFEALAKREALNQAVYDALREKRI